jgi:hypothetical protein
LPQENTKEHKELKESKNKYFLVFFPFFRGEPDSGPGSSSTMRVAPVARPLQVAQGAAQRFNFSFIRV